MNNEQLIAKVRETSDNFLQALTAFNQEQINQVPFEGSWTGGQVGEHILLAETGLPALLLSDKAPSDRQPDVYVPALEGIFLDFTTKLKAPPHIIPSDGPHNLEKLIHDFKQERQEIIDFLETEDASMLCPGSPFPTIGVLTRHEWVAFVIVHSIRHARQLRNILAALTEKVEA